MLEIENEMLNSLEMINSKLWTKTFFLFNRSFRNDSSGRIRTIHITTIIRQVNQLSPSSILQTKFLIFLIFSSLSKSKQIKTKNSNLPTGGFISSSGLESYIQHGFLHSPTFSSTTTNKSKGLLNFIKSSLNNYSNLNLPFLSETHLLFSSSSSSSNQGAGEGGNGREGIEGKLKEIDDLFEVMCLNEVTRKASIAQGIALLTLYERAFSSLQEVVDDSTSTSTQQQQEEEGGGGSSQKDRGKEDRELVDRLRNSIRKGELKGHLPIGFGILTALLGVSLR